MKTSALIAAAMIACCPTAAAAQSGPDGLVAAAGRLTRAVQAADARDGEPPRLSDPAAAAGIRAAFDISALKGADASDLGHALDVCGAATEALMSYNLFGLADGAIGPNQSPQQNAAKVAQLMSLNGARFQDEASVGIVFGLRCTAWMLPEFERFVESLPAAELTPERRQGVAGFRAGLSQIYRGAIIMAIERGMRPANSEMVLQEAEAQADLLARVLAPSDRADVVAQIDAAMPLASTERARQRFARIRVSMSRTDCGTICAS